MKRKSHKIIKACALGLSLLLIGGLGANILPKTYAEEQRQESNQEKRIINVHFNVGNQGYKIHYWHDGDANGQTHDFDGTDEYGPYININVKNDKTKLNFIIAKIEGNNWGEREYKGNVDGHRTIDLTKKDISQIWVEAGKEKYKLEGPSKPKVDDKIDWAEKINELINKIDDLKLSPGEKANLAIKLYEIKDSQGKRTEEDYKKAEEIFNQKAKEVENNNPGSGKVEISKEPTVEKITKDSTKIKGIGVPGAKIEIYYGFSENDMTHVNTKAITVDKDGNWSIDKPAYMGIQPGEIIWVSQIEEGKKPNKVLAKIENIPTSDFIKDKIRDIRAKDIRIWKGDTINWNEAYEIQGQAEDDKYKFINDELRLAIKKDIDKRSSESKGEFKGKVEFTFRDGSKLELDNTLYVFDNVVGPNVNTPADAITIEMKLGIGVRAKDNPKKIGNEENPVVYETYKVKPGTDIKKYKVEILKDTILNKIPLEPIEGYENPVWTSDNGTDFKVDKNNRVFTAKAVKKSENKKPNQPEQPNPEKKPEDKPKQKESKSRSYYNRLLAGAFQMPKQKTSKVTQDQYDRLRKAYMENKIMVKSAKFLLENAPNTIKPVKAKLERQVKNAEAIIARTEKILKILDETGLYTK